MLCFHSCCVRCTNRRCSFCVGRSGQFLQSNFNIAHADCIHYQFVYVEFGSQSVSWPQNIRLSGSVQLGPIWRVAIFLLWNPHIHVDGMFWWFFRRHLGVNQYKNQYFSIEVSSIGWFCLWFVNIFKIKKSWNVSHDTDISNKNGQRYLKQFWWPF